MKQFIKLLLLAVLSFSPSLGQAQSFFSDRAVGVSQFNGFTGLVPISYGQVRVCNLPLTTASPCLPLATVQDLNGVSLPINGGNFGQIKTDVVGRFYFKGNPGDYWIQVVATGSNTPQLNYPVSIAFGATSLIPSLDGIVFASAFPGTVSAKMDAACAYLNGVQGTIIVNQGMGAGWFSSPPPDNCNVWDMRGNGGSNQGTAFVRGVDYYNRVATTNGGLNILSNTLMEFDAYARGVNSFPGGAGTKSQWQNIRAEMTGRTIGERKNFVGNTYCYGKGDCISGMFSSYDFGGYSTGGDEGSEGARVSSLQGFFDGVVPTGTVTAVNAAANYANNQSYPAGTVVFDGVHFQQLLTDINYVGGTVSTGTPSWATTLGATTTQEIDIVPADPHKEISAYLATWVVIAGGRTVTASWTGSTNCYLGEQRPLIVNNRGFYSAGALNGGAGTAPLIITGAGTAWLSLNGGIAGAVTDWFLEYTAFNGGGAKFVVPVLSFIDDTHISVEYSLAELGPSTFNPVGAYKLYRGGTVTSLGVPQGGALCPVTVTTTAATGDFQVGDTIEQPYGYNYHGVGLEVVLGKILNSPASGGGINILNAGTVPYRDGVRVTGNFNTGILFDSGSVGLTGNAVEASETVGGAMVAADDGTSPTSHMLAVYTTGFARRYLDYIRSGGTVAQWQLGNMFFSSEDSRISTNSSIQNGIQFYMGYNSATNYGMLIAPITAPNAGISMFRVDREGGNTVFEVGRDRLKTLYGIATGTTSNTDLTGDISLSAASTGTYTFTPILAYGTAPRCTVTPTSDLGAGVRWWVTVTTTTLTVNTSSNVTATFNYSCHGRT